MYIKILKKRHFTNKGLKFLLGYYRKVEQRNQSRKYGKYCIDITFLKNWHFKNEGLKFLLGYYKKVV